MSTPSKFGTSPEAPVWPTSIEDITLSLGSWNWLRGSASTTTTSSLVPQRRRSAPSTVVELIDTSKPDSDSMIIFLERTASDKRPHLKYFSDHPNSGTVLESIVRTLKDMSYTFLASLTTSGSNDTSSPLIPLLNFTHTTPHYQPIIDEPESDHEHVHEPEHGASTGLPWLDAITLTGIKLLHTSTQSSGILNYHADDRFVGSKNVEAYVPSLHNLRQIQLEPNALSLLDFAILADCVHIHNPLYTMLEHHCYWFVQIVCAVIEKLYPCTVIHNKKYALVTEDTIRIPANDYLPDLAGRTMGILVCKVEDAVISVVADKFKVYKETKLDEIKTKWQDFHRESQELLERVAHLESLLRAHNLDPNVNVDSQQS